jgi:hypothetical protein
MSLGEVWNSELGRTESNRKFYASVGVNKPTLKSGPLGESECGGLLPLGVVCQKPSFSGTLDGVVLDTGLHRFSGINAIVRMQTASPYQGNIYSNTLQAR